ncbi:hypothetical protein V502_02937 [Pseudogymnoascus sp. VKM F-4520 (FW-2644)]|nr:hypothetical protein V502_02937 [Pseudogymnoascus sp. VKM F-4520 (FW-2644)]
MLFLSWAGRPLYQYINPENENDVIERATSALKALHNLQVLHKDAKPRNMLWDEHHGRLMLVEFERAEIQTRLPLGIITANRKRIVKVGAPHYRKDATAYTCAAQAKMTDQQSLEREDILAKPEDLITLNYKYMRIICGADECMKAISLGMLGKHLRRKHNVNKEATAKFIDSIRRQWGKRQIIPEDGLRPQFGIRVVDGVRFRRCPDLRSRSAEEVEKHWDKEQHGAAERSLVEQVRLQSWGESRPVYWIVEEEIWGQGDGENEGWGLGGLEGKIQLALAEEWVVL